MMKAWHLKNWLHSWGHRIVPNANHFVLQRRNFEGQTLLLTLLLWCLVLKEIIAVDGHHPTHSLLITSEQWVAWGEIDPKRAKLSWQSSLLRTSAASGLGVCDMFWKFIFSLNRAEKWFNSKFNSKQNSDCHSWPSFAFSTLYRCTILQKSILFCHLQVESMAGSPGEQHLKTKIYGGRFKTYRAL